MDGAFAMEEAVARADTIVFLDFSRARGYLGSVKRLALAYLGRPAPDFAPGCEDKLDRDFWRLLKTIHGYPSVQRPRSWPISSDAVKKAAGRRRAQSRRAATAMDAAIPVSE